MCARTCHMTSSRLPLEGALARGKRSRVKPRVTEVCNGLKWFEAVKQSACPCCNLLRFRLRAFWSLIIAMPLGCANLVIWLYRPDGCGFWRTCLQWKPSICVFVHCLLVVFTLLRHSFLVSFAMNLFTHRGCTLVEVDVFLAAPSLQTVINELSQLQANWNSRYLPNVSKSIVCKMFVLDTEAHQGKQRPVLLLCGHDGHHPSGLRYLLCDAKHCLLNWWCTQCTNQTYILFIFVSLDCSRLDGRGRTIYTIFTWNFYMIRLCADTYIALDILIRLSSVWWGIRSNTTKDWQIIYQIAEKYVYNWERRKLASVLVWVDARLLEPPHAGIVLEYLGCFCTWLGALNWTRWAIFFNITTSQAYVWNNSCRYAGCLIREQ